MMTCRTATTMQRFMLSLSALVGLMGGVSATAQAQSATDPFIGTISYMAFNFAPRAWAHCDGQLIAITQNDALFSLLGTTYGGDGRTTFALPDMRGRLPVHQGAGPGLSSRRMGQRGGQEAVVLTAADIGHTHSLQGSSSAGNVGAPSGASLATDGADTVYSNTAPNVQMHPGSITQNTQGTGQAHENRPPMLGVYCNIALFGIYPSRS